MTCSSIWSQQREYEFNIYLSDNDDLNRVGQENKKLTFR
jgi:hypothetical protein